ncbi:MAG TPA: TonB-dependent receptor [Terriglobales bacterium]|nr:TonB-dependent receptor [Terriglobales bacterium]
MPPRFALLCSALIAIAAAHEAAGAAARPTIPADTLRGRGDSLARALITLQPVVVTTARIRRDEPASGIRVTPLVLRQTPALDAYDLLRQDAGLEVHDQGQGPGFASDASLRGFSSDHSTDIALWVDGVPINEPVNGHAEGYNEWNVIFPEAIEGIDVVKGPTSALYGNFALSGAVSVRTLDRVRGAAVWLDPGSYGHLEGGVLTGYDRGADGAVFGLRGVREDGWRPHSAYTLGQAHGRIVHALSRSTTLDAGVEFYSTRWDSPGFLTDSAFDAGLFRTVEDPTNGGFKHRAQERLSLRVLAGPSFLWRTTAYATQGRWQLFLTIPPEPGLGEGSGSQTEEEDHRYGFGLTSAASWFLPRTEITLGTEGRWDHSRFENWLTLDRVRDLPQVLVTAWQGSGALFLQSTEDLGRHLRLTLGGRWDLAETRSEPDSGAATSHDHGVFSPKLGALYRISSLAGLYVNVSRGFKQTDEVVVDPTLPFITEWAYETGLKTEGRHVSGAVALYRMDISNEQSFDPVTASSTSGGASRRQGVELELTARPVESVTLSAEWAFNDARYRHWIDTDGTTLSGARVMNTAKYVGTLALGYAKARAPWHVRLGSNVVGPYTPFDEPGVVLRAYGLLHLSGGVRVGNAEAELGVRNLLNRRYSELRAAGFVSPGGLRSVLGSVRYTF